MADEGSNGMIRTDEFDWLVIDTEEKDQKILAKLERVLKSDPGNPELERALENAKRLHGLIPRAKDLKWYVLLFPDYFTYLTWGDDGFSGSTMPYVATTCADAVDAFEEMIRKAEERGVPEEVKLVVLSVLFDQLKDFLGGWALETQNL